MTKRLFTERERGVVALMAVLGYGTGMAGLYLIDPQILGSFIFIWGGQVLYKVWREDFREANKR